MKDGRQLTKSISMAGSTLVAIFLISCSSSGDNSNNFDKSKGFANQPQKVSYAFGVNIGNSVSNMKEKRGADSLDAQILAQGIIDRLSEEKEVLVNKNQDSLKSIIRSYFQKLQERKKRANKKKGQEFLQKKRKEEDVSKTKSGLTYKVIKEGSGATPDRWDSVRVHYHGTKVNGDVFDSSVDRGKPAKFPVKGSIVKGWTEALQMMEEGAEWKIFLPPKLAYGERGKPARRGKGKGIGPSETLIFELELQKVIEVDSAKAAQSQGKKRPGGGLSPAQKRRLRKQMQQRRGR